MQSDQPNYCPSCGAKQFAADGIKSYRCGACGYRYFQNVAAAVAAIVVCGDEVLLAKRAFEPAKGLYDFPGGFIDPDETLEQGLLRELQEELAWQPALSEVHYWLSCYNTYQYAGVTYKTADSFFKLVIEQKPQLIIQDDVAEVSWQRIADIKPEQLAFNNVKDAIIRLQQEHSANL